IIMRVTERSGLIFINNNQLINHDCRHIIHDRGKECSYESHTDCGDKQSPFRYDLYDICKCSGQSRISQSVNNNIHTYGEKYDIPWCPFDDRFRIDGFTMSCHQNKENSNDAGYNRDRKGDKFTDKIADDQYTKDIP